MSYRVLNSISVKNLSGKEFVKDKSSLLVVLVDKSAKKNKLLIHMDKVTKGGLFKSINSFVKSKAKSLNLQSPDGVSSKEVLLMKTPDKSNTYLWLDLFKSISKIDAHGLRKSGFGLLRTIKKHFLMGWSNQNLNREVNGSWGWDRIGGTGCSWARWAWWCP